MLLALRLTVFAFFVAVVVHLSRHYVPGDRRIRVALVWTGVLVTVGALSILHESGFRAETGAIGLLLVKLLMLIPLAGVMWVAIYGGMLLGDGQGGYWIKAGTHARDAWLWSGVAVLGLLACNYGYFRLLAVPLAPAPTGPAIVPVVLRHLMYSVGEEFFYRGCVQALLVVWLARLPGGKWWAVIIASVVFTAQHVVPPIQLLLVLFPAGVVFGLLFARFGVRAAIVTHLAANLVMAFVLPRLI